MNSKLILHSKVKWNQPAKCRFYKANMGKHFKDRECWQAFGKTFQAFGSKQASILCQLGLYKPTGNIKSTFF